MKDAKRGRPRSESSVRVSHVGVLLREWRAARRLSQLDLSFRAHTSARHISYIETGKAEPSRDMVMRLADALGMPLRERNVLLMAAGYAPRYPERPLDATELTPVRQAIDLTLAHHEPHPAYLINRHWDVLQTNGAAKRLGDFLCGGSVHTNMVRQFCDPTDMRAVVENWEEVARDLLRHLQDEIAAVPSDETAETLLEEALTYPGVPDEWRNRDLDATPSPLLTVVFRKGDQRLRFFSTIARFGTARDITVEELRIECAFPADEVTAAVCQELAG